MAGNKKSSLSAVPPTTIYPPMPTPLKGAGNIIGPESETELLGCQDEDEAVLMEGLLVEYAVASENGLRLRQGPSLEAPILVVLPFGAGVYAEGESIDGWLHVRTGRLEGWMLAKHLEALPTPDLVCADG